MSVPRCPRCNLRHTDPAHPYCAAMQRIRRCIAAGVVVPAAARIMGRSFVAFELDPTRAARARARVENTQAMHPVFLEEQAELAL
jgi:hypothetical protein